MSCNEPWLRRFLHRAYTRCQVCARSRWKLHIHICESPIDDILSPSFPFWMRANRWFRKIEQCACANIEEFCYLRYRYALNSNVVSNLQQVRWNTRLRSKCTLSPVFRIPLKMHYVMHYVNRRCTLHYNLELLVIARKQMLLNIRWTTRKKCRNHFADGRPNIRFDQMYVVEEVLVTNAYYADVHKFAII